MKRQIPFALVFIFGFFTIFQYFVPHESSEWVYEFLLDWILIIGIFALALGIWSLWRVSIDKINNRRPNWGYSYVTLAGLFLMIIFGFTAKNGDSWGYYFPFVIAVLLVILMLIQTMKVKGQSKILYISLALLFLIISILIGTFDKSWSIHLTTSEGLKNTMFMDFFDYILIPILATMFSLLAFFIASAAYRAFRARNVLATLLLMAALIVMLRFNFYLPGAEYIARMSTWLINIPSMAGNRAIIIGIGLGVVATALKVILGIERGYMGKG